MIHHEVVGRGCAWLGLACGIARVERTLWGKQVQAFHQLCIQKLLVLVEAVLVQVGQ